MGSFFGMIFILFSDLCSDTLGFDYVFILFTIYVLEWNARKDEVGVPTYLGFANV